MSCDLTSSIDTSLIIWYSNCSICSVLYEVIKTVAGECVADDSADIHVTLHCIGLRIDLRFAFTFGCAILTY